MLQHTFLLIYRNFKRFRGSFIINLIGLSTGLASTMLIYLWVQDEMAVDKFHENEGHLYQVLGNHHNADRVETMEATPDVLAHTLAKEIPEIRYAVNLAPASWFSKFTLSPDGVASKIKAGGQFVDTEYFNVFTFPLLQGTKDQVLKDPRSIVISEQLAKNLFNTTVDVVGKTIKWNISQFTNTAVVSGIFKDVPESSTQQFDFVLSMEAFRALTGRDLTWGNHGPSTFVVLNDGADSQAVNEKTEGFVKAKFDKSNVTLFLRPYSRGYLFGGYENGVQSGGRITYVRLFSIIAMFILIIACINFMNLSTAKASRRIKEVGIKKAIGASRSTLILQYLSESILMSFVSLLVALILVQLMLPQFNEITGKQLNLVFSYSLMLSLSSIVLFTGLLAGSYPAFYLSGFSPSKVLKGKLGSGFGEQWARQGLVVFQFALSVIFIVAVIVVSQQIEFVQSKNLGFDKDHVILFDKEGSLAEHQQVFLSEARRIPGVVAASTVNQNIVGNDSFTIGVEWDGKNPDEMVRFSTLAVDYQLFETLNVELASGRVFSQEYNDSNSIVINQAAVDVMGLSDPIGKKIIFWGNPVVIIGVVRNIHFESFHEKLKPFIFRLRPEESLHMLVRLESGRESEALVQLEKLYTSLNPGFAFSYKFLDQDFQKLHEAEQRVATLANYFAGLAIVISCLGLFGLASFTAERRRKEIGLRKVLGSSVAGIVYLLSRDFTSVVIVSIVIGLPLAYAITSYWLESFAFHVDLQAWYFFVAGVAALVVAWLTVGSQAIRAAMVNPTECLNEE